MSARAILTAVERLLGAAAALLALWPAAMLIEARYTNSLPPPSARMLPGDTSRGRALPVRAPARGSWIARLEAPTIRLSATVLEGSDDGTLALAAGHIEETALPGQIGNMGIAGHRDTTFRPVRRLRVGDPLIVRTRESAYEYTVTRTFIVRPEDVYVLDPSPRAVLTLVTCYPFEFIGHAPQRFIVQAALKGRVQGRQAGIFSPATPPP